MVSRFLPMTAAILAAPVLVAGDLLEWAHNPISGHWVGFASIAKTWTASETNAESMQGHLLTVHSAVENAWTLQTFNGLSTTEAWIGLSDIATEGTFAWTSSDPLTFTNFAAGEPDDAGIGEDGVSIGLGNGQWHDRALTNLRNYIVERIAPPTSGWSAPVAHLLPTYAAGRSWPCDIDGDGRTDLLVVGKNGVGGGRLCPLLQQPDGSFVFGACAAAGPDTFCSAVGDFDGDGHVDVVSGGGLFDLFLNRGLGGGAFGPTIPVLTTGTVTSIAAADIDLDGRAELVVAWFLNTNQSFLSVFRNASAAGFAEQADMLVVQKPYDLDAGDMNGDGLVDFHATSAAAAPHDQVFFGQGTLNLIPGPVFNVALAFVDAALADLDGDSDLDVAYRADYPAPNSLFVAWNDGAGNLTAGPAIAATDLNGAIAAADIDGDGIGDVIASEGGARRIVIVRSLGGGTFASPEYLALESSPGFVTAADVRGDASPEIVVAVNLLPAAYHVTLLENLAPDCNGNGIDDPRDIELGIGTDANVDGAPDLCQPAGVTFCAGDGTATACPCAASTPPGAGCANSTGHGGRLTAIGSTSIATDTLRIQASDLTPSTSTRLVQGAVGVNGGLGVPFGDGLHCAGGALVRIVQRQASNGVVAYGAGVAGDPAISISGGVTPGRRVYQVIYRDVMPYCTSATFNTTNAVSVEWGP